MNRRTNATLKKVRKILSENSSNLNEVELGYKESEDVVVDLINAAVNDSGVPKKYKGRGFESLYNSLKPYARSQAEVYGKKKLSTSEFWKNATGKAVDTSKTDVKGDRNYSVKFGPAQLMSGATLEAEATFLVAAEKSGLSAMAKGVALDKLEELQEFSGRTIGPDMNVKKLKKQKASEIKDEINKKAFEIVKAAESAQKDFQKYMNELFTSNNNFRLEFIYEAMTGNAKFSDSSAIADTMLCINSDATKVKIEVVTSANNSYVKKVAQATKIDVNFKTGSYDIKGKKAGYSFFTAVRLGTQDLSSSVTEMNEVFEKHKNIVNEASFWDILAPFIEKIKASWDRLKTIFLKGIELVKKGFDYVLSAFQLEPTVIGWQELDSMDMFELAS